MSMILKLLGTAVIGFVLGLGAFFAGPHAQQTPTPLTGSFSPTGGGTYRLGQSIGTSDTTFKLSSFKEPVSNIPYTMSYLGSDIGYGTISPQSSISEFVSFTGITQNTDGSATLSGVARGISRTPGSGGCVASTTLAQSHAGQSIFILSNQPCFYVNEYIPLRTNATSSAVLVFGSTTMPRLDLEPSSASWNLSTGTTLVTLNKLNATALVGVSNSTQAVNGVMQLATGVQAGSSTLTGSTGANLGLSTIISTSSPYNSGSYVVVTQPNSKIKQLFLDLTEAFNITGATLIKTLSASSTAANPLTLNGLAYSFPGTRAASSSVLAENGSGGLSFVPLDWRQIASTTLAGAVASTTVSFATTSEFMIVIDSPQVAGSSLITMTFNNDAGTNYSYRNINNVSLGGTGGGTNGIQLSTADTTATYFFVINVSSPVGRSKVVKWNGGLVYADGDTTAPIVISGMGRYVNTSAAISSVTFGRGGNLPANTRITVYGSAQ